MKVLSLIYSILWVVGNELQQQATFKVYEFLRYSWKSWSLRIYSNLTCLCWKGIMVSVLMEPHRTKVWKSCIKLNIHWNRSNRVSENTQTGLIGSVFKWFELICLGVAASILQRPPPMFPTAPVFPTVPLREFEPRPFPGIIGGDADLFPDLRGYSIISPFNSYSLTWFF